jgi:integrase
MPTIALTDRGVASLAPHPTQIDYFDEKLAGFALRVSPGGRKTWTVLYRHNRRLRRITVGTYPAMKLATAREAAKRTLRAASRGEDPAGDKRRAAAAETFGELAELYLTKHAKVHKRSWKEDERILNKDLLPKWKTVKVGDVKRSDVRTLLEGIVERDAGIMANRTQALVRKIFNFAIGRELVEVNPCAQLDRPAPSRQRDRVLSEDEIRQLWAALETLPAEMAAVFKLRLITAQRAGEVANMRWADVDLKAGWWTVPAEESKNGLPHRVPLSRPALDLLKPIDTARQQLLSAKPDASPSEYVLAGARGKRQRAEAAKDLGVPDFVGHDLRRTAASLMAGGGVPRLVISKILNHIERGVTAVYDRHSYDAEKRSALNWWGARLTAILKNRSNGKLLAFRRGA